MHFISASEESLQAHVPVQVVCVRMNTQSHMVPFPMQLDTSTARSAPILYRCCMQDS